MNKKFLVIGKGGAGKSTTVEYTAAALVKSGVQVTVVCLDPQATLAYRILGNVPEVGLAEVLIGSATLEEATYRSEQGFDVVPGSKRLEDAAVKLGGAGISGLYKLRNVFANVGGVVLFDAVPKLTDFLIESAFLSVDGVIGVSHPDRDAITIVNDVACEVVKAAESVAGTGHTLTYAGTVATMTTKRSKKLSALSAELEARRDLLVAVPRRDGDDRRDVRKSYQLLAELLVA